ncbi:hypothetical protein [Streptomyces boninensis]|uniref:hypothetical protein n=1 Tax=Streptomyces boninensis TaxID=2039455 RepID=UPI003B21F4EC
MEEIDLSVIGRDEVPASLRELLQSGWLELPDGAWVIRDLVAGYSGDHASFVDVLHLESSINGRGITDLGLPSDPALKVLPLLRRSLAYACLGLKSAADVPSPVNLVATVSLSSVDQDITTSHVTFTSVHDDLPPYLPDLEGFSGHPVAELSAADCDLFSTICGNS